MLIISEQGFDAIGQCRNECDANKKSSDYVQSLRAIMYRSCTCRPNRVSECEQTWMNKNVCFNERHHFSGTVRVYGSKLFIRVRSRSFVWSASGLRNMHALLTFTGMQNMINRRSAEAKPPRKTFVGVAGNGLSRGQRVEAMIMTFPEKNYNSLTERTNNIPQKHREDLPWLRNSFPRYFKKETRALIKFPD